MVSFVQLYGETSIYLPTSSTKGNLSRASLIFHELVSIPGPNKKQLAGTNPWKTTGNRPASEKRKNKAAGKESNNK